MSDDLAVAPITARHPDLPPATEPDLLAALDTLYRYREAEDTVARLTSELAEAKAYRDWLAVTRVPETLHEMQRSTFRYPDGVVVETEHRVHCHVLAPRKMDVCGWLRDLDAAFPKPDPADEKAVKAAAKVKRPLDLLSCTMSVAFKAGEYTKARAFAKAAATCLDEKTPLLVTEEWDVNTTSLKAFLVRTFVKDGLYSKVHDAISFFNQAIAVLRRPAPPIDAETNPLG